MSGGHACARPASAPLPRAASRTLWRCGKMCRGTTSASVAMAATRSCTCFTCRVGAGVAGGCWARDRPCGGVQGGVCPENRLAERLPTPCPPICDARSCSHWRVLGGAPQRIRRARATRKGRDIQGHEEDKTMGPCERGVLGVSLLPGTWMPWLARAGTGPAPSLTRHPRAVPGACAHTRDSLPSLFHPQPPLSLHCSCSISTKKSRRRS